ncbi:MAG: YgjP-like metallopeptidase domain-containing protein [Candidatus Methylacidiphilales bacterium]|nr:YgjP-like metallopeptidase domain-containing protein [Candidatus Methylacidiphilales bacterium]
MKRSKTDSRHKQKDQLCFFFGNAEPPSQGRSQEKSPALPPSVAGHRIPSVPPAVSSFTGTVIAAPPVPTASSASVPVPTMPLFPIRSGLSSLPKPPLAPVSTSRPVPTPLPGTGAASSGTRNQEVIYRRNDRARRYILRVDRRGIVSVTIPRRGSLEAAQTFVASRAEWIERQQVRRADIRRTEDQRKMSSMVLLRGQDTAWSVEASPRGWRVRLADESVELRRGRQQPQVPAHTQHTPHPPRENAGIRADRAHLLRGLRVLAETELPPRTEELAHQHGIKISRVTVRAQRSRWGSCSADGAISLNWRLIHAPPEVRDYLIIHELMHRRQMNHSARFWREVEAACPDYRQAEKWLDTHSYLLDDSESAAE